MLKNLKHSLVFILTIVVMLPVAFVSLAAPLAAPKPVSQNEVKGISVSIDPIINGKWSGLGIGIFSIDNTSAFDGYVDTLLANGFTSLRIDIPNYQDTSWLARSKAAVIRAIAKGANVTWGVTSNSLTNIDYVITAENWPTYRQAILDNAQWAQDNGVYEFQLGNEEEMHIWRHPVSITRTNNVATATFKEDHGFTAANPILIWNSNPSRFNFNGTITVTGAKIFTYPSTGANGPVSNPGAVYIGSMFENTIRANMKSVATDVQAIFTRGNISYTSTGTYFMHKWHTLGRGDIDILAWNVYSNQTNWQTDITNMARWWGADHTYITEFNLNSTSLDSYSTDETAQAVALSSMIEYIKASGITRAYNFCWNPGVYGVLKNDGTYRKLWDVLTGTGTSAPDITVAPTSKDFGSADIDSTTNPAQTFTITNTGSANLTVGTITITGTDPGQFIKSDDTASGQTIAAGASKTIIVTFDPSSVGEKTAALSIPLNDPDKPTLTADLTCTGSDTNYYWFYSSY
jgi:hypothetical protein